MPRKYVEFAQHLDYSQEELKVALVLAEVHNIYLTLGSIKDSLSIEIAPNSPDNLYHFYTSLDRFGRAELKYISTFLFEPSLRQKIASKVDLQFEQIIYYFIDIDELDLKLLPNP